MAAVLILAGCQSRGPTHSFAWRSLSKGLISGLNTPRRLVIRDEASYYKVWAEHAAESNRVALPPHVDFPREMVIVVAMGTRPTGGYLIEVVDVQVRGRSLHVLVGEREPSPGTLQIQHETQPYQFIALPMVAGRVEFRTVHEAGTTISRRRGRPGVAGDIDDDPDRE